MKLKYYYFSLCFSLFAFVAQAQNITGNVTDDSGVPLPGANVVIQGTTTGVSTDFDGNFQIQAAEGQVLQISFIGYTSQNVTVGDQDFITVSLEPSNELEEVIVTSLGFTDVKDQQGSKSSIVNTQSV